MTAKVAVVTGSNRGIGRDVVRQLAAKGYRVVLTARDAADGEKAAAELQARFAAARADPQALIYLEVVRTTPVVRDLLVKKLNFEWARAQLVHDDPAKTRDTAQRADVLLFPDLVHAMGRWLNPAVQQWACFDTAFHHTLPLEARTYALPASWRDQGLRRFGFHGLNHQHIAEVVRVPRLISCHLGGGASLCAIRDGQSIATTMGYTPLEGLVMATRSG